MKNSPILLFVFFSCLAGRAQTPGHVMDVNARSVQVDSTDGRKMLIVLLPAKTDTALIGQLWRFQQRHSSDVRVIGVLAPDPNPQAALSAQPGMAKLVTAGVILTKGMAARDSATGPRGSLLKYLSGRSRNRQVDKGIEGCKYFLSEKGKPFAQLGPNGSLDSRVADYIVQTRVPGDNSH